MFPFFRNCQDSEWVTPNKELIAVDQLEKLVRVVAMIETTFQSRKVIFDSATTSDPMQDSRTRYHNYHILLMD